MTDFEFFQMVSPNLPDPQTAWNHLSNKEDWLLYKKCWDAEGSPTWCSDTITKVNARYFAEKLDKDTLALDKKPKTIKKERRVLNA